jgi:hypothetical protein
MQHFPSRSDKIVVSTEVYCFMFLGEMWPIILGKQYLSKTEINEITTLFSPVWPYQRGFGHGDIVLVRPQIYYCGEEHSAHFSLNSFWQDENVFMFSFRTYFQKFQWGWDFFFPGVSGIYMYKYTMLFKNK